MEKKFIFVILLFCSFQAFSQEETFEPSGKPFALIYVNFHKGITGCAVHEAAFKLVRRYIGYEYFFSPGFYVKINVDVGSPDDLLPVSKIRRYTYFNNAYLRYTQQQKDIKIKELKD